MKWQVAKESIAVLICECLFLILLFSLSLITGYRLFWMGFTVVFAVSLFTIIFFRDPERESSGLSNCVLSPADGKVVYVGTENKLPFSQGPMKLIAIFLSLWDVHVNRIPVTGKINLLQYSPGRFYPAYSVSASKKTNRC